jgi:hypothetical protein
MSQSNHEKINEDLIKTVLGDRREPLSPVPMNKNEKFVVKVFRGCFEISSSIDRLKDFETYISKFPFSGTRVKREAYLQFIVEAHLQELYLLRERLISYGKIIERAYGPKSKNKGVGPVLEKYIINAFENLSNARSQHIHQIRYSDVALDRLQLIGVLRKGKGALAHTLRSFQIEAAKDAHIRIKEQSRKWNRYVAKVLEQYFKVLAIILFNKENDSFNYPTSK